MSTVLAFLGGALVSALAFVTHARTRPAHPVPPPPPTAANPHTDEAGTGDEVNLAVAAAVLDVADRLTSAELCRRLGDAIAPLRGVTVVTAAPGDPFDPTRHVWESTEPDGPAGTIAAVNAPGLAAADGAVHRKARVTVHG